MKLACASCHAGAAKAERAGFPKASFCQGCHAPLPAAAREIPSRRIYKLPDFVIFPHGRHANAKVECARCHGKVEERAELTLEVEPTMKACVDCHRQAKATIVCTACHELGQ